MYMDGLTGQHHNSMNISATAEWASKSVLTIRVGITKVVW